MQLTSCSGHSVTEPDSIAVNVGQGKTVIAVRNLWLLYLYASSLYAHMDKSERVEAEADPEHVAALAARILVGEAETRLERDLSRSFVERHDNLTSVRGQIDHLRTARGGLLLLGQVACRYEDLSIDTPRNRYVLAALKLAASRLGATPVRATGLRSRCLAAARRYESAGVTAAAADRSLPRTESFGHLDRSDQRVVTAAHFVFEWLVPSHVSGSRSVRALEYDERSLRTLFEAAVRSFYTISFPRWRVGSRRLRWPNGAETASPIMPGMQTDISMERDDESLLIVDTKFTSALNAPRHGHTRRAKSGHLYQLYTYLRIAAEERPENAKPVAGLLMYPSTVTDPWVDVSSDVYGHTLRIATVDLNGSAGAVKERLLDLARTS